MPVYEGKRAGSSGTENRAHQDLGGGKESPSIKIYHGTVFWFGEGEKGILNGQFGNERVVGKKDSKRKRWGIARRRLLKQQVLKGGSSERPARRQGLFFGRTPRRGPEEKPSKIAELCTLFTPGELKLKHRA